MKIAIISLKSLSSRMIAKECEAHFDQVDMIDLKFIETCVDSDGVQILYGGRPLDDYDCVYCRGSSKYNLILQSISEALEGKSYLPLTASSFTTGHNKYLTTLELQKSKIAQPKSYLASTGGAAKKILKKIHYPVIIKIPSGTHGKGVMVAESFASASSVLDALEVFKQPYIIQEFIDTGAEDIRAIVVGNRVVAAMKRRAQSGELRANIHAGGDGIPYMLSSSAENLAIRSAKAIGAEISGVDLLEGAKMNVLEVNLSPGLQGITKATGKNIAGKIAQYLHERTLEYKKTDTNTKYTDILKGIEKKPVTKHSEVIVNLDVKAGRLKLPMGITKLSGLKDEDEVLIKVGNRKILIKDNNEVK
ncbi:RimK family alpha-L-glutamate ligase [archaeon]|jgi:ribosomal protein S6--L-glutamate ligase|nr:RimK family alpha-L-glutamate ligase [archaeon]